MSNRRQFIALLGAAAAISVTWPSAARAQQADRARQVGLLISTAASDPEGQSRRAVFLEGLQQLGWIDGRNVRIVVRWGINADDFRKSSAELVGLAPDVIFALGGAAMEALMQATHDVPIVFAQTPDPVGSGFVASLSHPGGNATGFTNIDYRMSGKWLELLREISPGTTRLAALANIGLASGRGQLDVIQRLAPSLGMDLTIIDVRNPGEIEQGISAFARAPNGGLIVLSSAAAAAHRKLIVALTARHRLPAIFPYRFFAAAGGLLSYGPEPADQVRRAAGYVDRILRGEKPGDLPVQNPVKHELILNLKTASALGLDVPPTLLATADEVIE
jgi:putative ABC transport system substrate-binding protein